MNVHHIFGVSALYVGTQGRVSATI